MCSLLQSDSIPSNCRSTERRYSEGLEVVRPSSEHLANVIQPSDHALEYSVELGEEAKSGFSEWQHHNKASGAPPVIMVNDEQFEEREQFELKDDFLANEPSEFTNKGPTLNGEVRSCIYLLKLINTSIFHLVLSSLCNS